MTETAAGNLSGQEVSRADAHTAFRRAVRDGLARSGKLQKDLAAEIGKSPVDISRYLSSPKRLPRDWLLIRQILLAAEADLPAFESGPGRWWGVPGLAPGTAPSTPDASPPPVDREGGDQEATVADALGAATGNVLAVPAQRAEDPIAAPERTGSSPAHIPDTPPGPREKQGIGRPDATPSPTRRSPDAITYQMTPVPDRARPGRGPRGPRRRLLVAVAALGNAAVLIVAAIVVAVILTAPRTETVNPPAEPIPDLHATGPWPAAVLNDVPAPGVALRSAPSKNPATEVGRLPAGAAIDIECGVVGELASTQSGRQSTTWLRTPAGSFVSAHYIDFPGPDPIPNCEPTQPPVPVSPTSTPRASH